MSIDPTKSIIAISRLLNRDAINERQKSQTTSMSRKNNSSVGTNVSLSQGTMQLLQSTENDIDIEKIEQIKQAITNGKLVIDPHKIADELIEQMIQDFKNIK
ncbi:flagellar biosynthesis anti-sigma factor FlgM [uncultured Gilliamella sp.]|uniref:flagellar biosynthesis anti-sigma factor FlgM n=1 Tax=uncultured Gilliamella sp. TaxID=1193505 RepID=UPI0025D51776|nr:flagellar biosynthesis anti-sigma factor FlgM [uncultured Gilliamella sp.]